MHASIDQSTTELIHELEQAIDELITEELNSEWEDHQKGVVSLLYAKQKLRAIHTGQAPELFLRKWLQFLENRYFRLTDEDSGEYGSGRDALSRAMELAEKRLTAIKKPASQGEPLELSSFTVNCGS